MITLQKFELSKLRFSDNSVHPSELSRLIAFCNNLGLISYSIRVLKSKSSFAIFLICFLVNAKFLFSRLVIDECFGLNRKCYLNVIPIRHLHSHLILVIMIPCWTPVSICTLIFLNFSYSTHFLINKHLNFNCLCPK